MNRQSIVSADVPALGWVAVAGVAMLAAGGLVEMVGHAELAGFLGLYSIAVLIFAAVGAASLSILKSLSAVLLE